MKSYTNLDVVDNKNNFGNKVQKEKKTGRKKKSTRKKGKQNFVSNSLTLCLESQELKRTFLAAVDDWD